MESTIQTIPTQKPKYTFIDLFAGCGGLSLGLEKSGFSPIFVNEIVPQYLETYRRNHNLPEQSYYLGDIADLNKEIEKFLIIFEEVDLVCGGPPCQGFSMANRQRIIDDPRNKLYKEFLLFLSKVQPKFFIMENVKGLKNKWHEIEEDIKKYLPGYNFDSSVLYAEDYGVPQHRERFILIGNRVGVDTKLIFDAIYEQKRKPFTLGDALAYLPKLGNKDGKGRGSVENNISGYTECPYEYTKNDFYYFINGSKDIQMLYNHKNRYNNERDIEIFRRLPQGANSLHESISDIMPYTKRKNIFKDKFFKLRDNEICKTITAHMQFDCNMYIHPWEPRGLSPREAARIQTFPDDYVIYGPQNKWYAQVGNAVPVKLAEVIGNAIKRFL